MESAPWSSHRRWPRRRRLIWARRRCSRRRLCGRRGQSGPAARRSGGPGPARGRGGLRAALRRRGRGRWRPGRATGRDPRRADPHVPGSSRRDGARAPGWQGTRPSARCPRQRSSGRSSQLQALHLHDSSPARPSMSSAQFVLRRRCNPASTGRALNCHTVRSGAVIQITRAARKHGITDEQMRFVIEHCGLVFGQPAPVGGSGKAGSSTSAMTPTASLWRWSRWPTQSATRG